MAVAPLMLGGCFEAGHDLIGAHALAPVQLDSLVTLNGYPYRLDRLKGGVFGCELRRKSDNAARCWERYRLKFERSARGNLIVQATAVDAKFLDDGNSVFLLLERSTGSDYRCYYLLGEPSDEAPAPVQEAEHAIAAQFGDEGIDRKALLEIVDAYERSVLPLNETCPATKVVVVQSDEMRMADDPEPYRPDLKHI